MTCKSLNDFISRHYENTQGLRLGQRFYNLYVKEGSWPELFYGNDEAALPLIEEWLTDHQYIHSLPDQHDCWNCFEGKSDMDHTCKVCGGSGIIRKGESNEQ